MGFNEFLSSIFGNKATRDMKEIKPWVDKVKAAYPEIAALDNDALRAKTEELKAYIRNSAAEQRSKVEEQKASVIAIVFHAGHHENDASDYSATGIGQQKCHGYAVALQDATNGYCQWGVYGTELGCCPTDGSGNKQNNYSTPDIDWSGYAWTQKIITAAGGKDKLNATEDSGYPATYYAVVDYAHKVPSPANSTGWFLPSIGQMWNVYQNRASLFEGKTVVSGLKSDWYWSSSEFYYVPADYALCVDVRNGRVLFSNKRDRFCYGRSVLAVCPIYLFSLFIYYAA